MGERSGSVAHTAPKGRFTIRTAGVFMVLSAIFELVSVTSGVSLFGSIRVGVVAVAYHLSYSALFLAMGIGLLQAKPWTYRLVVAGTLFNTLDKLVYVITPGTMRVELERVMERFRQYQQLIEIDINSLLPIMTALTVSFCGCWWGFVVYLRLHRSYFGH